MSVPKPEDFLASVADFTDRYNPDSSNRPIRIASIDSAYTAGNPKVIFEGETTLTTKRYPCIESYQPNPGERVALVPIGKSYLIIGAIATRTDTSGGSTNPSIHTMKVSNTAVTVSGNIDPVQFPSTSWRGGIERIDNSVFQVKKTGIYDCKINTLCNTWGSTGDKVNHWILRNITDSADVTGWYREYDDVFTQGGLTISDDVWLIKDKQYKMMLNIQKTFNLAIVTWSLRYCGR